jgi:hypothetical protein
MVRAAQQIRNASSALFFNATDHSRHEVRGQGGDARLIHHPAMQRAIRGMN